MGFVLNYNRQHLYIIVVLIFNFSSGAVLEGLYCMDYRRNFALEKRFVL
jgi:hypothetical protein